VPVKVSYAYCDWSDREEVRKKIKNCDKQSMKISKEDKVKQDERNVN
jgi:hypothetical protein